MQEPPKINIDPFTFVVILTAVILLPLLITGLVSH